jgi:hypothetical protein
MPMRIGCRVRGPWRSNSSAITACRTGVTAMMSGLKSVMSCTCRSVKPPLTGTTRRSSRPPVVEAEAAG